MRDFEVRYGYFRPMTLFDKVKLLFMRAGIDDRGLIYFYKGAFVTYKMDIIDKSKVSPKEGCKNAI